MLKKILYSILILTFMIFVYTDQSAKDIELPELESTLIEKTDLAYMKKCNDRELLKFIGVDPALCDDYIYYKGTDALSVSELLIVKLASNSNLQSVRDLVDKRIESQIKTFDSYGPAQVALLKNAIIIQKDKYLFYYTGEHGSKYEEVFTNAI